MDVKGKVVVVTGGAEGIGEALARGAHARGARSVVVADLNIAGAKRVADAIGGHAVACDVSKETDIQRLITETEKNIGPIALFCANAGIGGGKSPADNAAAVPDEIWERSWKVNVMHHVWAARHLLPLMTARGQGYFLNTVSAAGLLNQIRSAVYATTKHAAVGFAENVAIAHRDQGIRVSILCPQAVDTTLLREAGPMNAAHVDGVITPEQCATAAFAGIADERFCILPHPQVDAYMKAKTADYDRWIGGMAKLQRNIAAAGKAKS